MRVTIAAGSLGLLLLLAWTIAGKSGPPSDDRAALDDPAVRALRDRDPDAFEALARELAEAAAEETSGVRHRVGALLRSSIVPTYIPLADDQAVQDYLRVMIAELEELRARSYYRCYVFLSGSDQTLAERAALEAGLSERTVAAGRQAIARLISSSGTTPVGIDDAAVGQLLDNEVIPALPAWHGERVMVLRDPLARDIDRTAACDVTIDLYKTAVDWGEPGGARLRRYLLARRFIRGS